jgi:predicted lactoylglutathione lyase
MIFDQIVLSVSDLSKSKEFYSAALLPLGITLIKEVDGCAGFGIHEKPSLWICADSIIQTPMHIAFVASDRKAVDMFYEASLLIGGKDNGKPGIREQYYHDYYGAYIIDPDGHNIEAVCRKLR